MNNGDSPRHNAKQADHTCLVVITEKVSTWISGSYPFRICP